MVTKKIHASSRSLIQVAVIIIVALLKDHVRWVHQTTCSPTHVVAEARTVVLGARHEATGLFCVVTVLSEALAFRK